MDGCIKATAEEIAAFESMFGVRLPPDMRTYYETIGGTQMGEGDQAYMAFWPLSKVMPVSLVLPSWTASHLRGIEDHLPDADKHFLFMDHLIHRLRALS